MEYLALGRKYLYTWQAVVIYFNWFQFATDNMTDVWINYNVLVHLLQGQVSFPVKQLTLNCMFYFNNQSYCYRSYLR